MVGVLQNLRAGASHGLLKRGFITYLALLTGCASTVYAASPVTASSSKSQSSAVSANPYNLPDLGLSEQKSPEKKVASKDELMLGSPTISSSTFGSTEDRSDTRTRRTDDGGSMLFGLASAASSQAVKDWFSRENATARLNLGAGEEGVKTGSFDLLVPLFDNKKDDLIFTQMGVRRSNEFSEDYRTTLNLGVGYRHQVDKWLLGVNSFYDRDMTGENDRVGLGVEAWTDNLKLSGNTYLRLSDWKKSQDFDDYLERPANGWDLRAEAFLPSYPQLGGKLMYEKYYGDEVGLFGSGSRQKDPSAATLGLSYTPVPLVSLSADYRQGQDGLNQTSMRVGFNYRIGESLGKQLDPTQVNNTRLLQNARYNLVERRNEIVLDHKKIEHGSISLPTQLAGNSRQLLSFPVTLGGNGVHDFTWKGSAAAFAQVYGGGPTASIQLPINSTSVTTGYTLQAVGVDSTGKLIESNVMSINVQPVAIQLQSSKTTALGDGVDMIDFTATLTQSGGQALTDSDVAWNIAGQATVVSEDTKTNNSGQAHLKIQSRYASAVRVTVAQPDGVQAVSDVTFIAESAQHPVSVTASVPSIQNDGVESSTITALVKDQNGVAVGAGVTVSWVTSLGNLSVSSSETDGSGKATAILTSNIVGAAKVTASTDTSSANATVNVTQAPSTIKVVSLSATPDTLSADGVTQSVLKATVKDKDGFVGVGTVVTWSTSLGTLSATTSSTDASGIATVTILSSVDGVANVVATAEAGSTSANVTFTKVVSDQVVNINASPSSIPADGVTTSTVSALVQDGGGNPVPAGITVHWSTTAGALSAATSTTDATGKALVTITGSAVGTATVSANAATGGAKSTNVDFVATSTANVTELSADDEVPSNYIVYSYAGVTDQDENPVVNATVEMTCAGDACIDDRGNSILQYTQQTTNSDGYAQFPLYPPQHVGTAVLTARVINGPNSDSGRSQTIYYYESVQVN